MDYTKTGAGGGDIIVWRSCKTGNATSLTSNTFPSQFDSSSLVVKMIQSVDLFTVLPTTLSCIILRDWLRLKSVMTLDTAYCCHAHRGSFEDLLQSSEYYIDHKVFVSNGKQGCALNGLRKIGAKLKRVVFQNYNMTPEQWTSVTTHCRHLTQIDLSCLEKCTPEIWDILRSNRDLERVEIGLFAMEGSSKTIPPFTKLSLPKLNTLELFGPLASHHFVRAMQLSNQLVRLGFSYCKLKPAVLLQIPRLCPHLKCLNLAGTNLTDDVLTELTASCVHIQHLDISNNMKLTDNGVCNMVQNLTTLRSLNIEDVPLTDASLVHIQQHCANTLHTLYLGNQDNYNQSLFHHQAVNELLEHCVQLTTFSWQEPDYRNNDVFPLSSAAVGHLTTLFLRGLDVYINANGLAVFVQHAQQLTTLVIQFCTYDFSESDAMLYRRFACINTSCPQLRELYIYRQSRALPRSLIDLFRGRAPQLKVQTAYPVHLKYAAMDMPL